MKLSHIVVLIAIIFGLSSCANHNPKVTQLMSRGNQAYQQQNYHTAFKDVHKAAKYGNAKAQYTLGYMLYYGIGIRQNQVQAIQWLQAAAKQGEPRAIHALSLLQNSSDKILG